MNRARAKGVAGPSRRRGTVQSRFRVLGPLAGLPLLAALGSACAVHRPVTGEGGIRAISEIEIRKSNADDLLALIQALRPSWLLGTGIRDPGDPLETGGPLVLINDVPPLPLFTLQSTPLTGVKEIRFLTATAAETRYRVRSPQGVILVIRPPGPPAAAVPMLPNLPQPPFRYSNTTFTHDTRMPLTSLDHTRRGVTR